MRKNFDYGEARKRVEKLTGKPTYLKVEGEVEKNGSEVKKVDKNYQKVELNIKANPDEGANSTLRLTGKDGIFEEKIHHPRSPKVEKSENRLVEIEDKKEASLSEAERKRLELDKKEQEVEAKRQAALIDAEKYRQQAEEVRQAREKLKFNQEEQPPLLSSPYCK